MGDFDQFWAFGLHIQSTLVGAYLTGAVIVFWWSIRVEKDHPTERAGILRLVNVSFLFALFWPIWVGAMLVLAGAGKLLGRY